MGVTAVLSAKGSPGATTTTVALARAWHSATSRVGLAIDLDPFGGDFSAGVLGGAAPSGFGVLSLATERGIESAAAVVGAAVEIDEGAARVIPGVPDAARGGAIPLAWDVVSAALSELSSQGIDLFLDGGRLDGGSASIAWLPDVDRALLVVRPSLPWVAAARRIAQSWPEVPGLQLVVVDAPSPYSVEEVVRAVGVPLAGTVPFEPRAALVHSEGAALTRSYRRSAYARSIERLARTLHDDLTAGSTAPDPASRHEGALR